MTWEIDGYDTKILEYNGVVFMGVSDEKKKQAGRPSKIKCIQI